MPTNCSKEGCKYNVFGGGYCHNHQYLRTDKSKAKLKPRTPIRKVSVNQRAVIAARIEISKKDNEFWAGIWEKRPHIDFETNLPIWGESLTLYFHHVLPKGELKYKKFRFCDWNIVLLSWNTHTQAEIGIDHVPRVKAYRDYLIRNLDEITAGTLIPDQNTFDA